MSEPRKATDAEVEAWHRKRMAQARKIIAGTKKVIGSHHPPDLIMALSFVIGELAMTADSPAAALHLVAEQFAGLAKIELAAAEAKEN